MSFKLFSGSSNTSLSNSIAKNLGISLSKIDLKHYVSAIEEIIKHCYENNDVMSWHMQLNQIYGTANFSYNQMAESSTVEQYAVRNLQISDLFFTTT